MWFVIFFSKVDEYGFERGDDFDYKSYELFMSIYLKVLARRSKKWCDMLGNGSVLKRTQQVKRYIRKGIPSKYIFLLYSILFYHIFYPGEKLHI